MRPGRHGGMASSEFESIIARNGEFLVVRRAGGGDGQAGLHCSISNDYICGIGGGWLPEYSRYLKPQYDCACTPNGECRTGAHGTNLTRGWRNIAYELMARRRIRATKEIRRLLGDYEATQAKDYSLLTAPMADPSPAWNYSQLTTA